MSLRFRILALDVDGTLLDGRGALRPGTAEAVSRAARAGIRPVLCTGRRFRRARPIAERLGLGAPMVCNSGAIVKSSDGSRTLWRADFEPADVALLLDFFKRRDEPLIAFADRPPDHDADFIVARKPTGRHLFDEYVALNEPHALVLPDWPETLAREPLFHLCAIGERPAAAALERALHDEFPDRFRTFVQKSPRYAGTMCEVLRSDAGKWSAVLHLAELWDVAPQEICAVGDDLNDLPMIEGAGFGVAMGHAPEVVRLAADHVTGDNEQDGLASFVERVLLA